MRFAAQVKEFASQLRPHQLATTPDGSTVLDKAVVEHNLAACAALYCNISTAQLGSILGTGADQAEAIAARMVKEGRLKAGPHPVFEVDCSCRSWSCVALQPQTLDNGGRPGRGARRAHD